jgi:hypothetical protein
MDGINRATRNLGAVVNGGAWSQFEGRIDSPYGPMGGTRFSGTVRTYGTVPPLNGAYYGDDD